MAKSKIVNANRRIAEKVMAGYNKIESGVVGTYEKIENSVVGGFNQMTDRFTEHFLTREGESVSEAKARVNAQAKR